MLNLIDSCALDISIDLDSSRLIYGEKVVCQKHDRVKLRNLVPALLNKSLCYPEEVYDIYQGIMYADDQHLFDSQVSYDLLYLPSGLLGVEFIKTHIYHTPENDEGVISSIVEVQFGILTVVLQKNQPKESEYDFDTYVEEGYVVKVHKGEKLTVPQGFFYTFINAEETPVIFVRVYKKEGIVDYNLLRRERGLAYFCIRKNAKQEFVLNPTYKNTPKIQETCSSELSDWEFDMPIYQAVREDTNQLSNILWC
jgi:oxalate decarboxylase/phosphoglucose isomerase-like protein (cupin superfamily)